MEFERQELKSYNQIIHRGENIQTLGRQTYRHCRDGHTDTGKTDIQTLGRSTYRHGGGGTQTLGDIQTLGGGAYRHSGDGYTYK